MLVLLACVLMFFAAFDYWGLIDFLVYPVKYRAEMSSNEIFHPEFSVVLLLYLQDTIVSFTQHLSIFVIDFIGWEFDIYITILFVGVTLLCALLLKRNEYKAFHAAALSVCIISILAGLLISEDHASRRDVVNAFADPKHRPVIDVDLLNLLKTGQYDELDRTLQDLHDRFKQGDIDSYQFAYHYDTLEVYLGLDDIDLLNEWVEQSDNKLFAHLMRGSLYLRLGRDARGVRYIRDTPKEQLVAMQKYFDLAAPDLEKVIAIDPHVVLAHKNLYVISSIGDYKTGKRRLYRQAASIIGDNYLMAYHAAIYLQAKWGGRHNEIYRFGKLLRENSKLDPRLIGVSGLQLAYEAYELSKDEHYEDAARLLKLALLYAPRSKVFYELGLVYSTRGEIDSVLELMTECISVRPDAKKCIGLELLTHNNQENYRQAEISARKILPLGLLSPWMTNNAGFAFERVFDYELAQEMYIRTLKKDPVDMYALKRLYSMSVGSETNDELILPYFRRAAEKLESDAGVSLMYADILRDTKPSQALPVLERYLSKVDHKDESMLKQIKYAKIVIAEIRDVQNNKGGDDD